MSKVAVTDVVLVRFMWMSVSPDPVQYKPYNPVFAPQEIYIEVAVPAHMVKSPSKGGVVLTPDGMGYACKQLSIAIARAHTDSIK